VSYTPAEDGGPDPQRSPAQPGSSRRQPELLHLPCADDGGSDPQPSRAHPASNGRLHACQLHHPSADSGGPDPQTVTRPSRLPTGDQRLLISLSSSGERSSRSPRLAARLG